MRLYFHFPWSIDSLLAIRIEKYHIKYSIEYSTCVPELRVVVNGTMIMCMHMITVTSVRTLNPTLGPLRPQTMYRLYYRGAQSQFSIKYLFGEAKIA